MKKSIYVFFFLLTYLTVQCQIIPDFEPCIGSGGTSGLNNLRLLIAKSSDGMNWTRTNMVLADRSSVADGIILPSNRILVYYVAGCIKVNGVEQPSNHIKVAISDDMGKSWNYKNVQFNNLPVGGTLPVDPNVVLLENGDINMLVTIDPDQNGSQKPCTYSAISTDGGFTFTLSNNPVYQISGQDILDPENFRFGPINWKLWAGGTPGKNILGLSTNNGVSFTHQGDFCSSSNSNNPSECYIVADVIKYDDNSFKMYAFGTSPSGQIIRSLSSSNSEDWTLDPTINLVVQPSNGVEDLDVWAPTVIKLSNNSFLMIYETKIPSNASTGFSSIAILQNDTTVNIGNTLELNSRIYSADYSIRDITNFGTWTSTNPSVATVNAFGKVTAISQGTTNIYKTYNGINSNNIVVNVVQAVPVELVFFEAICKNKKVNLNWQTATEINNKGFEIERNTGNGWEYVDFVSGKGNSNLNTQYSYEDKTLLSGVVSYRIKQIDYDGKISYSSVVEIDLGLPKKLEIYPSYPNPLNPTTILQFSIPKATNVKVKVYNNVGQEVAILLDSYQEAGIKKVKFDANQLKSGIYYYKIITEYGEKTSKIMLVK